MTLRAREVGFTGDTSYEYSHIRKFRLLPRQETSMVLPSHKIQPLGTLTQNRLVIRTGM